MGTQHGTHMLNQSLVSQSVSSLPSCLAGAATFFVQGMRCPISDVPPLISGNMRPMIARSGPTTWENRSWIGLAGAGPFRVNAVVVMRQ